MTKSAPFVGRYPEKRAAVAAFDRAAAGQAQLLLVTGEAGLGKTRLVQELATLVTTAPRHAHLRTGDSVPLTGPTLAYGPFIAALRDLFASGAAPHPAPGAAPHEREPSPDGGARSPGSFGGAAGPSDGGPLADGVAGGSGRSGAGRGFGEAGVGPAPVAGGAARGRGGFDGWAETGPAGGRGAAYAFGGGRPATRQRVFERVLGVLGEMSARTTLVLVLEDLHWADASTRDLLAFLAVRLRRQPVLIVATVREEELTADARRWFAELGRCPRVTRLRLSGLADAEVAELVTALLPADADAADVAAAVSAAEGNPLYAQELARAARPWPPASIAEVVLARVSCVDADVREVIDQISVTDDGMTHELLAATVPLPERTLLAAVRRAVEQRLLTSTEDGYALPHGLIRQILYADLLPGERRRLHRRYAHALAARTASDPALLARHWHLADCPARAATSALTAARLAVNARAYPEAHRLYALAVTLSDHLSEAAATSLWPEAARAASYAGEPQSATEYVTRALALSAGGGPATLNTPRHGPRSAEAYRADGSHAAAAVQGQAHAQAHAEAQAQAHAQDRARLLERLGACRREAGDPWGAIAALEEAQGLLATAPEATGALEARVLAAAADMRVQVGDPDGALPLAQRALRMAERIGALAEHAHALTTLGIVRAQRGDLEAGLEALCAARDLARRTDSVEDVLRAASNHMYLLCTGGRFAEAREVALTGRRAASELGAPPPLTAVLDFNTAAVLVATGRWPEADQLLAELVGQSSAHITRYLHLLQLELAVARGDRRRTAELTAVLAEAPDDPRLLGPCHACQAEQALDAGELATAADHVLHGLRAVGGGALAEEEIRLLADGARLAAELALLPGPVRPNGLPAAWDGSAVTFAERAAAIAARHCGEPVVAAFGALAAAEHSRADGSDDRATWRQVADAWRAADQPYREAYARLREAGTAIRAGRREQAGRALAACLGLAEPLSAAPLLRLAHELATRGRLTRPPDPTTRSVAAQARLDLTEREAQVLALLSRGESNRQIARSLYISDRTVAVHVSHILEKLGVRNRTEAALVYARTDRPRPEPAP
ncbi:helix-turn-helix transcriptional regulator [Streptomyces sp. NPDC093221]|uniref:helix-turn-helix transcriptional regulator n=1 Tax=Streptomyces sp. NPDC093221 TaxID=3366032 RepID=UPI003805F65F